MPPAEPASVPTVSDAPADDALADQVLDRFGRRAGRVRAVLVGVEEVRLRAVALVPVGAHHHPLARLDGAVLVFPRLDAGRR